MVSMVSLLTSGVTIGKRLELRTHIPRLREPGSSYLFPSTWRIYLFSLRVYPITESSLNRVIPCGSRADAERIRKYITGYQSHPNQLKFDDRMVVSTFAGESCRFGTNSLNQGWSETLRSPDIPPVLPLIPLDLLHTSENPDLGLVYSLILC